MFSPLHRASFIESKIVSIVASACFWVTPRFTTRMLMRSDLSIWTPAGIAAPLTCSRSEWKKPSRRVRIQQGIRDDAGTTRALRARSRGAGRLPVANTTVRGCARSFGRRAGALAIAERPQAHAREPLRRLVLGAPDDGGDEPRRGRD